MSLELLHDAFLNLCMLSQTIAWCLLNICIMSFESFHDVSCIVSLDSLYNVSSMLAKCLFKMLHYATWTSAWCLLNLCTIAIELLHKTKLFLMFFEPLHDVSWIFASFESLNKASRTFPWFLLNLRLMSPEPLQNVSWIFVWLLLKLRLMHLN